MVRCVTIKFPVMIKSEVDLNSQRLIYHFETLYQTFINRYIFTALNRGHEEITDSKLYIKEKGSECC